MIRWIVRVIVLAALVAAGIWGWHVLFPGAKAIIRKRLGEVAQLASFNSNEGPLAKMMNSEKLASYFADDVEIVVDVPGQSRHSLTGRSDVLSAEVGLRGQISSVSVQFPDINILVGPDQQSATANVTLRGNIAGERDHFEQELLVSFTKIGGAWLIRRVETVKTLR